MRLLLSLLLLLAACDPSLNDDDDTAGDDDDATADDDDATDDDDDTLADDDDTLADDDDTAPGDDDDVSNDDDDFVPCVDDVVALGPDEVSALGFSGSDVLDPIAGPLSAPATWTETELETEVSFAVTPDGAPLFHDLSMPPNPPPDGPDYQCLDWLELPVSIAFSSADGAFDEVVVTSLRIMEDGGPWMEEELDWQNLVGTFAWTDFDPADWDTVGLSVSNGWDETTMQGQVSMSASRELPNGLGEGMVGPVLRW
jgi:hypothetical protein